MAFKIHWQWMQKNRTILKEVMGLRYLLFKQLVPPLWKTWYVWKLRRKTNLEERGRMLPCPWRYDVRHCVSWRDGFDGLGSWDRHRRHRRQSVPAEAMLAGYMWMLLWAISNASGRWNQATENGRAACWHLRREICLAKGSWFFYYHHNKAFILCS